MAWVILFDIKFDLWVSWGDPEAGECAGLVSGTGYMGVWRPGRGGEKALTGVGWCILGQGVSGVGIVIHGVVKL